jgi:hypothetical protein
MGRRRFGKLVAATAVAVTPATSCAPDAPAQRAPLTTPLTAPLAAPTAAPRTSGCVIHGADPDPACTPSTLNSAVTEATIGSTICVAGFTTGIRPSVAESKHLKVLAARAYAYDGSLSAVEGDHLIPLELGGNPESGDDISNFWDEPRQLTGPDGAPAGSAVKDGYESWLRGEVCRGRMTLADAQRRIRGGWYESFLDDGRP